jgi:hypothetical protein
MGLFDLIKKTYTTADKSIGGILPGGYVVPKQSTITSQQVAPQKSTLLNIQPTVPYMKVTLPSGNQVVSTPVITQSPVQFTPVTSIAKVTPVTQITIAPAPIVYNQPPINYVAPISSISATPQIVGPPITREQAKAEIPFFEKVTNEIGIGFRKLTNDVTAEDISYNQNKESSISIIDRNKPFIQNIPTGTIIDKSSGIKQYSSLNEKSTMDFFASGLSQPIGIKIENLNTALSSKAESEYNINRAPIIEQFKLKDIELQSGIDTGMYTLEQANIASAGNLNIANIKSSMLLTDINTKYNTQFKSGQENLLQDYGGKLKGFELSKQLGTTNIKPLIESGLTLGAGLATGGGYFIGSGGVDIQKALTTPGLTMNEKSFQIAKGAFDIGVGLSMVGTTTKSIAKQISNTEAFATLETAPFKLTEIRYTGKDDFSIVKGFRKADGLTQKIDVSGIILKNDEYFIQPGSKFTSITGGVIKPAWGGKLFGIKPQAYTGVQVGEIGAKGFSLPIANTKNFATFGKGTIVTKMESFGIANIDKLGGYNSNKLLKSFNSNINLPENKFTSSPFAAITKPLKNDLYLTKSGKINKFEFNPTKDIGGFKITKEGLRIDASLKDLTLTKIIPKSNLKGSTIIDIYNPKSNGLGLSQISKSSFSGSGEITKSIIQNAGKSLITKPIFKTSFKPMIAGNTINSIARNSLTTKFRQSSIGLNLKPLNINFKQSSIQSLGLSNKPLTTNFKASTIQSFDLATNFKTSSMQSLGLSSKPLDTKFKQSPMQSFDLATNFKQSSIQSLGLSSIQLNKSDLGLKNKSMSSFSPSSFSSPKLGNLGFPGGFGFPPIAFPGLGFGLGISKPKRKGKKRKTQIRPSFTASVFDIRGSLPKSKGFGITPFQIRALPNRNKNFYGTKFK